MEKKDKRKFKFLKAIKTEQTVPVLGKCLLWKVWSKNVL